MDYTTQLLLIFALSGAAYFFLYRFVFFKLLKWKMLHSIWLPIVFSVIFTGFGIVLLTSPVSGGSMADLAGAAVLTMFNIPVVVFFILFAIDALLSRKNKAVAK